MPINPGHQASASYHPLREIGERCTNTRTIQNRTKQRLFCDLPVWGLQTRIEKEKDTQNRSPDETEMTSGSATQKKIQPRFRERNEWARACAHALSPSVWDRHRLHSRPRVEANSCLARRLAFLTAEFRPLRHNICIFPPVVLFGVLMCVVCVLCVVRVPAFIYLFGVTIEFSAPYLRR